MRNILLLVVALASLTSSAGNVLAQFDLNHFEDWTYTRPGYDMTRPDIGANRINLYKDNVGVDYTLISPLIEKGGAQAITVDIEAYSQTYDDSKYNAYKASPTIELLDSAGNVVNSVFYKFETEELERFINIRFDLSVCPSNSFKVRLACWNADVDTPLSVKRVLIEQAYNGDVNGDGAVNASDVTAIYNYILNGDTSNVATSDVNGDGSINASDVTAVYSIILNI